MILNKTLKRLESEIDFLLALNSLIVKAGYFVAGVATAVIIGMAYVQLPGGRHFMYLGVIALGFFLGLFMCWLVVWHYLQKVRYRYFSLATQLSAVEWRSEKGQEVENDAQTA